MMESYSRALVRMVGAQSIDCFCSQSAIAGLLMFDAIASLGLLLMPTKPNLEIRCDCISHSSLELSFPFMLQVGSLLSVLLLKYLGRKHTIITSGVLFFIAFLCIGNKKNKNKFS